MAYNRRNKLLQMRMVITIYLREKKDGVSTAHVYRTHIYPIYPISRSTLYTYLSTPIDKLLKENMRGPANQFTLEL
ncbi:MAG: hypothetical protein WCL00_00230 [Bacteroidota bacterium]